MLFLAVSPVIAEDGLVNNSATTEENTTTQEENSLPIEIPITEQPVEVPQETIEEIPIDTVIEESPVIEETIENTIDVNVLPVESPESTDTLISITSDICTSNSTLPCVTTDKKDYKPTEVVLISGFKYDANTTYKLVIYSPNLPAIRNTFDITTDSLGTFSYSYQLDGIYRPEYFIEVNDIEEVVVTKSTFKDSAIVSDKCIEDAAGFNLNCTANDISLANVRNFNVTDGCAFPGDTVSFTATWDIKSTANERYDIGLYFASEGQTNAYNGKCSVSTLPTSPVPPYLQLDGDYCGDMNAAPVLSHNITITALCSDPDGDNMLNLPYCTTWHQNPGDACNSVIDATPGAPSKCNCDDGFEVPIVVPYLASIEVIKDLQPSTNGGTFNLSVDGVNKASCVGDNGKTGVVSVGAGTSADPGDTHTVAENVSGCGSTSLDDYNKSISCVDRGLTTFNGNSPLVLSGSGPLTVPVDKDDDIVCNITNAVKESYLTIVKTVINDNGGAKVVSDFNLYIDGNSVTSGVSNTVVAGVHNVSEDTISGYSASVWGGDCAADGSITINPGESKTCTITNNDIQPKLTLVKTVINDNGGKKIVSDFPLYVGATSVLSGVKTGFNAGEYTVSETSQSGYSASVWGGDCATDGSISLAIGDDKTCTITNNDIQPTLTLVKTVVNDNGGTKQVSDFNLYIGSTKVVSGVSNPLNAGTYTASEDSVYGYAPSAWGQDCAEDGSVTLSVGENKTCTITNNDIQPKLTVIKYVNNTYGGTLVVSSFDLFVSALTVISGQQYGFNAGQYLVSETGVYGYEGSIGGACSPEGVVNLAVGDEKVCTITNQDIQPKLTVTKVVINDNGGTKVIADFPLYVNAINVLSGAKNGFNAGAYTVSETEDDGYTSVISGACASDGSVTLNVGDDKNCIITNDDIEPELTVTKIVINDDGGTKTVSDFNLYVNGNPVTSGEEKGYTAGNYKVSEDPVFGYAPSKWGGDCAEDGSVSLLPGDEKACTITNDDIQPTLTVVKTVVNDNGGTKSVSDFNLYIGDTKVVSGVANDVQAGTYKVSEDEVSGYLASSWGGNCDASGNVTIGVGENKTCTITNEDIQPTLTVIKHVINDNGGTKQVADFNLYINGNSVTSGVSNPLNAGTYTVSEDTIDGYKPSTWSNDCAENGTVTLSVGENKVCEITNDDVQAKLTVVKTVINDNGGDKLVSDFKLYVDSLPVSSGVASYLDAGTYTVSEDELFGYSASAWGGDCAADGSITLSVGDDKTCTITNNDVKPSLKVIKHVINDNGGTKLASDFTMTVTGDDVVSSPFAGNESGTIVYLDAGSYSVSEDGPIGYAPSFSSDCSGSISVGQSKTCTVTNNDVQPKLTLVKTVINDNGGTKTVVDFPLFVDSTSVVSGVKNGFNVGTYTASETTQYGYSASVWGGDCAADGSITLNVGDDKTCTITNDDIQPQLTVTKTVVNDNGGTKGVSDFNLYVNQTPVTSGFTNSYDAGTYKASEDSVDGYTASLWGGDCAEDGLVILNVGDNKTCTITNDDEQGTLIVNKEFDTTFDGEDNFYLDNSQAIALGVEWKMKKSDFDNTYTNWGNPVKFDAGTYNISEYYEGDYEFAGFVTGEATCNDLFENERERESNNLDYTSSIDILNGETLVVTFCNRMIEPRLEILKTNDASTNKVIGNQVVYTINIYVKDARVQDLFVKDLIPEPFALVLGSQTVRVNGILKTIPAGVPIYNDSGVGDWDLSFLGILYPDDIVTIRYTTNITAITDPGLYKDIAWAKANGGVDLLLLSSLTSKPSVDFLAPFKIYAKGIGDWTDGTNYVGSEVNVVSTEVVEAGVVLGEEIIKLPDTGINVTTIIVSIISLILGIGLVIFGISGKIGKKGLSILIGLTIGLIMLFSSNSQAFAQVPNLVVRTEVPKINVNSGFKITYSILSIDTSSIAIDCKVNKPTDPAGTYNTYQSLVSVTDIYGASGECDVTNAVLNQGDGLYKFIVVANSVSSDEVSVTLTTTKPETPTQYSKAEVGTCKYKISFKTAADLGKTVKVEVYRSTETSFEANSSTYAGEVVIGSDTLGSFEDTKPNCSKTYYYAIRAVDIAGNTSGFIGDYIIITIPGEIIYQGGGTGTGEEGTGEVEGETDKEDDENGEVDGEGTETKDGEDKENGDIEGVSTKNKYAIYYWIGGITLGGVAIWQLLKTGFLQGLVQIVIKRRR